MNNMPSSHSYVIQGEIARTKYHVIYKAKNLATDKIVTIKALEAKWNRNDEVKAELRAEAEANLKLDHPSICRTLAIFEEDHSLYVVREYFDGQSLTDYLSELRHPLDVNTSISILLQILAALGHAHERGIVHRNLNPDNIIICDDKLVKVIGFGKNNAAWLKVNSDGGIYHPIYYIAPEVFQGDMIDLGSDLYSIGVIAYIMLCKRLPWSLSRESSQLQQKQDSLTRPVLNPEFFGDRVPDWLFSIINKCMMVESSYRFESTEHLARAIKDEASMPFEPVTKAAPKRAFTNPIEENAVPDIEPLEAEVTETLELDSPDPTITVQAPRDISEPEPEPSIPEEPIQPPVPQPKEQAVEYMIASSDDDEHPQGRFTAPAHIDTLDVEPLREKRDPAVSEFVMKTPEKQVLEPKEPEVDAEPPQAAPVADKKPEVRAKIVIEEEEDEGMDKLKKVFVIMSLLSVAIIIFIAFKYYLLRNEPTFEKKVVEEVEEVTDLPRMIANDPIEMVIVPADTVIVGSMSPLADEDEFPIKHVRLRSFMIGVNEVSQREWMMVYSTNPSRFLGEDRPVENISFYDAIDFCNEKSILDGFTPCYSYAGQELICDFNANGYRLPTEAEWEHAAKGGARDDYFLYSGTDVPFDAGWFNENSGASTNVLGQKIPNALGIYDMSGNVFEWVWNWYSRYSYRMKDVYSGADTGTDKVIRGGSWYHNAHEMRVTNRNFAKPFTKTNYIGFRVVRTLN